MISTDLASIRAALLQLQSGEMSPELFGQLFPEFGEIDELMAELFPALDELIRELLATVDQGDDEEENERGIQLMLRELSSTAYLAGRVAASREVDPEISFTISPDAATELVRTLLAGKAFTFSIEVKDD